MRYKHEDQLRQRAERFIKDLVQAGIEGTIISDSFREYSVKVAISREGRFLGPAIVYYSPKKDSFTMKTHELKDASIASELQDCWDLPTASVPAPTGYQVYVDGSCLDEAVGYGLVVLKDGQVVDELYGPVEEEAVQGMRQVAGELQAVQEMISWCQEHGVSEVSLFYDYEGIEKWATGEWKANKAATQAYAQSAKEWPVVVHWHKVSSHTGNRWNDHADQLAKQGAKQDAPEAGTGQDSLEELGEKARALVELLKDHGITATFGGILNDQFARVAVSPQRGYVDLYNTRKRPLSKPYLHGFSDSSMQERIEDLWWGFLSGHPGDSDRKVRLLEEATYYYKILRPYGDCAFDFFDLASALNRACRQMQRPGIDVESSRYDFERLESVYRSLAGR